MKKAVRMAMLAALSCAMTAGLAVQAGAETGEKIRTIITTDGEVDDQDSLIRFLLYANEVDLEGIVQTSSSIHWEGVEGMETPTKENEDGETVLAANGPYDAPYRWIGTEWIGDIIGAYGEVYDSLSANAEGYPTAEELLAISRIGNIGYEGERDASTEGSDLIKEAILKDDPRTLYLQAWGGTNTIARALMDIEEENKDAENWEELHQAISEKLVITSCMEQDNAYRTYIAEEWPDLQFVNCMQMDAWAYAWGSMPEDESKVTFTADWMQENILNENGALLDKYCVWGDGKYYEGETEDNQYGTNADLQENWWGAGWGLGTHVPYDFLSEGDSPTYYLLLQGGLRSLEDLGYGGLSGRFALDTEAVNSKGEALNYWNPVTDAAGDGEISSCWKYVDDLQNDMAARADWCVKAAEECNHAPSVTVTEGIDLSAKAGDTVTLNAETQDPDGNTVAVSWSIYPDAGSLAGAEAIAVEGADSAQASLVIPEDAKAGDTLHVIVCAKDDGAFSLTAYQQVIITIE